MRRAALTAVALLLLASTALADLKIEGPAIVPAYRLVELRATGATPKAQYRWKVTGSDGAGKPLTPDVRKHGGTVLFTGPPGVYRADLLVVDFDTKTLEEAETTVTIGDAPPAPPVPPGPKPPDPPAPVDALTKAIQDAYQQEAEPGKASQVMYLALVCRGAGPLVEASSTVADLFARLKTAVHAPGVGLPDGALPRMMRAVGDYLNGEVGTSGQLDKAKAKAALGKLSDALGGLK